MQEENRMLGMHENMQFGWEAFALSPVAYITVYFKEVLSNLFDLGSILLKATLGKLYRTQSMFS